MDESRHGEQVGGARPTDVLGGLAQEHGLAASCDFDGSGQAVGPGANDNGIEALGHCQLFGSCVTARRGFQIARKKSAVFARNRATPQVVRRLLRSRGGYQRSANRYRK